jgi:hypothetical protein
VVKSQVLSFVLCFAPHSEEHRRDLCVGFLPACCRSADRRPTRPQQPAACYSAERAGEALRSATSEGTIHCRAAATCASGLPS